MRPKLRLHRFGIDVGLANVAVENDDVLQRRQSGSNSASMRESETETGVRDPLLR